jgi:hypothetical protein
MKCVISVSAHGLGHLSQISAVLVYLSEHRDFNIVIRCSLPKATLQQWLPCEFEHEFAEDDIGMRMQNALSVDVAASFAAYEKLHHDWNFKVSALAKHFIDSDVNLVVSDIAYLPLAAAKRAGIPAVGLCSLNWADVIERYFPEQISWIQQARESYQQADCFIAPEPAMPMPWLTNKFNVGPIGRTGENERKRLNEKLGLTPTSLLVLVGMGGVEHPLDLSCWPTLVADKPVYYLTPDNLTGQVKNSASTATLVYELGISYVDLVTSSDLVITKPGYGMFVEAAGAGVPVLYVERSDWPDVDSLTRWINQVTVAQQISSEALQSGSIAQPITELLTRYEQKKPNPVQLSGAKQAAEIISRYI